MTEHDVARLVSESDITKLIVEYCASIDDGEFARTGKLFEKGVWFYDPSSPITGIAAVVEFLDGLVLLYDGVPKTRHTLSNFRIDVSDDNTTAAAKTNVVVFQAAPESVPQIIFQGAYDDTFVREDGVWRFDERRFSADGIGDLSRHLNRIASPLVR
ncbi:nuclear transport factor 2 family protein [Rhodococcoides yunnanense]|uniref:nuclear transport factor 2 family protein n=1 Tax=Rhodococcoides yunnanense TaxID=278209 RepID=UPI000932624A|nr:nuclear transport factor 2 family protein [Rhodococcus yunnanensis]